MWIHLLCRHTQYQGKVTLIDAIVTAVTGVKMVVRQPGLFTGINTSQ